jgi:hypothetical protein
MLMPIPTKLTTDNMNPNKESIFFTTLFTHLIPKRRGNNMKNSKLNRIVIVGMFVLIQLNKTGSAKASGLITDRVGEVVKESLAEKIMNAFQPIIDLCQGISYPLAFIMVSTGFLLMMVGQTSRGVKMLKWAGIGYIGLMFVPSIMAMLYEVGKAMVE